MTKFCAVGLSAQAGRGWAQLAFALAHRGGGQRQQQLLIKLRYLRPELVPRRGAPVGRES